MIKFGGWESEVASFGCKFWWHQSIECQHVTSKAKSHSDDDVADANLLTSENQLKEGGHNTDDLSAQWIWNDIFCTSHDRVPNILVPPCSLSLISAPLLRSPPTHNPRPKPPSAPRLIVAPSLVPLPPSVPPLSPPLPTPLLTMKTLPNLEEETWSILTTPISVHTFV